MGRTSAWGFATFAIAVACTPTGTPGSGAMADATDAGADILADPSDAATPPRVPTEATGSTAWSCYFCADATATTDGMDAATVDATVDTADAPSPVDAAPVAEDAAPAVDIAPAVEAGTVVPPPIPPPAQDPSIGCGDMPCSMPFLACCRALPYGAGTCMTASTACDQGIWHCDDRVDCAGLPCCGLPGGGSVCVSPKDCLAQQGSALCKTADDCEPGYVCCGSAGLAPWFCAPSCAP